MRRALADTGYTGDGPPPQLPDTVWKSTSERYIRAYERLTGSTFVPGTEPAVPRLVANLEAAGILVAGQVR